MQTARGRVHPALQRQMQIRRPGLSATGGGSPSREAPCTAHAGPHATVTTLLHVAHADLLHECSPMRRAREKLAETADRRGANDSGFRQNVMHGIRVPAAGFPPSPSSVHLRGIGRCPWEAVSESPCPPTGIFFFFSSLVLLTAHGSLCHLFRACGSTWRRWSPSVSGCYQITPPWPALARRVSATLCRCDGDRIGDGRGGKGPGADGWKRSRGRAARVWQPRLPSAPRALGVC